MIAGNEKPVIATDSCICVDMQSRGEVYSFLMRFGFVLLKMDVSESFAGGETKMARRAGSPTYGRRYVGNKNKKEVHDLDNEKTGANQCQIDEIIRAGHAAIFNPDSLSQANSQSYDNCAHCIGDSKR